MISVSRVTAFVYPNGTQEVVFANDDERVTIPYTPSLLRDITEALRVADRDARESGLMGIGLVEVER